MAKQKEKRLPTSRPSVLSEERIVDSDSDSLEELEAELATPTPKQSASTSKLFKDKKSATKTIKHITPEPAPESNSEAESANGKEDSLNDNEASEEDTAEESLALSSNGRKRPNPPTDAGPRKKKAKSSPSKPVAPKAFRPPNGFEKTHFSASDYAADSAQFLREDLRRKQIWHITAPASVSIKDIKPFDIQDVRSGKPVFSKNGIDYGFMMGSHRRENLLLASGESVEYTPVSASISGTYHLREMGKAETKSETNGTKEDSKITFAATSSVAPKRPREQPTGLRMRYQPYGSTADITILTSPDSPAVSQIVPELLQIHVEHSSKKKARKEGRGNHEAKKRSQENGPIDMYQYPSPTAEDPGLRESAGSPSDMVDEASEAAIVTPENEKKRKRHKKRHRILEEVDQ